jgi:mediator of RNA polymerase II transcription subunit 5
VVALQLLEQLSSSHTNGAGLASICSVILTNPTGLAETDALPSTLDGPSQDVPDVGTSASANPFPSSSTLALMLPLIRLCANLVDPAPFPILAFTNRLLSLLQPYPAPPLDVGLEASALLPTLPDALSTPLRNCLSGLMADVALSQDAAQLQISDLVGLGALQDGVGLGPAITETGGAEGTIPSLPGVFRLSRQPLPIPLPRALDFLLAHAHRSARFTKSTYPQAQPPAPWENHLHILRAGRYFELDPEAFLLQLVESGLQACLESYQNIGAHFVKMFLFLVDGLPTLLRSWMDAEDSDWAYPVSRHLLWATTLN